jgi:hypothetical protein
MTGPALTVTATVYFDTTDVESVTAITTEYVPGLIKPVVERVAYPLDAVEVSKENCESGLV